MFRSGQGLNRRLCERQVKNQQGSVLIITLFVIVVMGYLAASLLRVSWSNHDSLTREHLGTQAWFIAQSASEWALTHVYPLNASAAVATECSTFDVSVNPTQSAVANITAGTSCTVDRLTCEFVGSLTTGPSETESLFRITSTAICGSGVSQVQRQQEVWVRELN